MRKRVCKEEQLRLIMECRQSGLSDYQWCEQNGVHPGNFYNWVSKLRREGYAFPESKAKSKAVPNKQDVVKIDLLPPAASSFETEQNVSLSMPAKIPCVAAELVTDGITIRLFNGADTQLIQIALQCIGGMNHAW